MPSLLGEKKLFQKHQFFLFCKVLMKCWFFLVNRFCLYFVRYPTYSKQPKKITSSIDLLNLLAGVMASKKPDSEKFSHRKDLERILENVFISFLRKVS